MYKEVFASGPQTTRSALNPKRQLPWCFLIFLGETLELVFSTAAHNSQMCKVN